MLFVRPKHVVFGHVLSPTREEFVVSSFHICRELQMVQQDRLFCFCGIATAETWLTLRLVYQLKLKIYNCCKKIITSIVSLCIAKSHRNFLALQILQKVIDAIAILALFDHLIFKNWFLDCNQFNCYVDDNSYCFFAAKCILFFKREYIGNRTC